MIKAAGILFHKNGKVLLLKRRNKGGDHDGEWDLPGGRLEDDETSEEAAIRECYEETNLKADPDDLVYLSRFRGERADYVSFSCGNIPDTPVKISDEHRKFKWFPITKLPKKLHPGLWPVFVQFFLKNGLPTE